MLPYVYFAINVLLDNITVFSNICLNSDIVEIRFAHVSMLFYFLPLFCNYYLNVFIILIILQMNRVHNKCSTLANTSTVLSLFFTN